MLVLRSQVQVNRPAGQLRPDATRQQKMTTLLRAMARLWPCTSTSIGLAGAVGGSASATSPWVRAIADCVQFLKAIAEWVQMQWFLQTLCRCFAFLADTAVGVASLDAGPGDGGFRKTTEQGNTDLATV